MAVPCFIVNSGTDFGDYIKEIKPTFNDLDKDGSGRNLLDGKMYRTRIATKRAWAVTIDRMSEATMSAFLTAMYANDDYVNITTLDPKENRRLNKEYYFSTVDCGVQRAISGQTYYDGGSVTVTER